MHTANELTAYLNDYFVREIWRPAGDLLGNISLSEADDFVRTVPLCNGLQDSRFDFSRSPSVTLVDPDHIHIAIPSADQHHLDATIDISDPLPNAELGVGFALTIDAQAGPPNANVNVGTGFNWGGTITDAALAVIAPWALPLKKTIEVSVEVVLNAILTGKLRDRLAGTVSYRFDRNHDLQSPAGNPHIAGIFPNAATSRDPAASGYVDLLIVADGFVAGDIGNFDDLADAIGAYLIAANEAPFHQFASDLRIWKLPLIAADPVDPSQRCIVPVHGSDRDTFNFSNLARIAEIGLFARQAFNRDPITIFASQISAADRTAAQVDAHADLRENTQGPFVLLNVAGVSDPGTKGNTIASATRVLIHELGHTPLGRYLADEYTPGARKTYHGLEPRPRNVSLSPISGWLRWQPWSESLLQFLPQDLANDGAYDFDSGIFRFAPQCRMRDTSFGDFCHVCAEELTFGLLSRGHSVSGINGVQGMADLEVEYLRPWTQRVSVHIQGGDSAHLDVFAAPDATLTRVTMSLAGSSVPKALQVTWDISGVAGLGTYAMLTGDRITIDALPGSSVRLSIGHDPTTGILGRGRQMPSTSMRVVFDHNRAILAANLRPPTNLIQSVALGAVLNPQIDPGSGRVSLPQPLWLQARIGGVVGFDVPTAIGFRLQGDGNFVLPSSSRSGAAGEDRRWIIDHALPGGRYVWSAQTVWTSLASAAAQAPRGEGGDCFEIGNLPFTAEPRPPVDPFDLQVAETATIPSLPAGLQASSWHPNDRRVKFQFEIKLLGQAFDGLNLLETALLDRDRNDATTVAIAGRVGFNLSPRPGHDNDFYRWRARAVDDQNRTSNWIEGRQFAIYFVAQRPTSLRDFARVIDRLNRAAFVAGGPIEVPRVFFLNRGEAGEKETDFSGLKKWLG